MELTAGRKSLAEDPKRYIPRRCSITIIIHNRNDAIKQHTKKIVGKDHPTNVHGRHLTAKNEKELETLIHIVSIYSQDIGTEFRMEKFAMLVMKRRNGTTKSRQN